MYKRTLKIFLAVSILLIGFGSAKPQKAEKPRMLEMLNNEISTIVDKVRQSMVVVEADFPTKGVGGSKFTVTGTGIIFSNNYIITCSSLVDGKDSIRILTADNKTLNVDLVGIDRLRGIALLKADDKTLQPIETGNVEELRPGNYLVIIGNTVDVSMASTVGTFNGFDDKSGKLKILANLTPGFSGGAVVNISGELVGVLTGKKPEYISLGVSSLAKLAMAPLTDYGGGSSSKGNNYQIPLPTPNAVSATPVGDILTVLKQIDERGEILYGFLGVTPKEVRKRIPNVANTKLIQVKSVVEGSPADKAGIKPNDYIILYDGKDVSGLNQFYYYVKTTPPGDTVEIALLRDNNLKNIRAEIGEVRQCLTPSLSAMSFPSAFLQSASPQDIIGRIKGVSEPFPIESEESIKDRIERLNSQVRRIQSEIKKLATAMDSTEK